MLLATATSILTGSNTLIALLECIDLQSQSQRQCKTNIWEMLPILGPTLPYT